jgi:hypothetical protein
VPGSLHHALLGLDVVALFSAGHRLSARLTDRLGERAVGAFVLGTTAAVAEALVLGLVSLGSDPLALTVAAVATFLAIVALVAPATPGSGVLLQERWAALSRHERIGLGSAAGVALLLVGWPLAYPLIGFDGVAYHLPEIAGWVHSGNPGSIEAVSYLFPFANYPITNEVALTWSMGIARSLAPLVVWPQLLFLATVGAGFVGLRTIGASRGPSLLATAAVVSTPIVVMQLGTPSSDLAALCWLVCAGALAAGVCQRPGLALPALVAAGLAAGTKSSTIPLLLLLVTLTAVRARAQLEARPYPALAGLVAGMGLGGAWYLRNAVTHGSPLWPFGSFPAGDPLPHVWRLIRPSLLSRPRATISPRVTDYLDALAGALPLAVAGSLAWLLERRRATAIASTACAGAILVWAAAPSTGQPHTPVFDANVVGTTRYAFPAIAAAAVSLAIVAAGRGRVRRIALALLVAALAWNLVRDVELGHVFLPYAWAILGAAGVGALAAAFRPHWQLAGRVWVQVALAGAAAVAAGAVLDLGAAGLLRRHIRTAPLLPGVALARWAERQPGFDDPGTVYFAGGMPGQLTGERLQHRLVLVPAGEPCAALRSRVAHAPVVVEGQRTAKLLGVRTPAACLARLRPSFVAPNVRVYGSFRADPARSRGTGPPSPRRAASRG